MPSIRHLALLLCLISTSGCYFYFHPPSNRAHPKVIPGAEIELSSKDKSDRMRCYSSDNSAECLRTGYERYHYNEIVAKYDGKKLTEGELLALVSEKYNQKWDRIESKKGTCRLSLVPTVIAGAALLAGGVLSIYGSAKYGKIDEWPSDTRNATYAATAATVGFGLLSYPLGGFACVSAHRTGLELGTKYHHNTEFPVGDRTLHYTSQWGDRVEELVKAFNAKVRKGGAAPAAEEPVD